jgi:hypothetical protein
VNPCFYVVAAALIATINAAGDLSTLSDLASFVADDASFVPYET